MGLLCIFFALDRREEFGIDAGAIEAKHRADVEPKRAERWEPCSVPLRNALSSQPMGLPCRKLSKFLPCRSMMLRPMEGAVGWSPCRPIRTCWSSMTSGRNWRGKIRSALQAPAKQLSPHFFM